MALCYRNCAAPNSDLANFPILKICGRVKIARTPDLNALAKVQSFS